MSFVRTKEVEEKKAAQKESKRASDERIHDAFIAAVLNAQAEKAAPPKAPEVIFLRLKLHPASKKTETVTLDGPRSGKRQRLERRFVEFGNPLPGEQHHRRCRDPDCRQGDDQNVGTACPCGQSISYWAYI